MELIKQGYKQTELGVIPEEWEVVILGDIITLKNGYAFSSDYYSESGAVLITPGNFKIEGGLIFTERNTLRYAGNWTNDQSFEIGDLLIVMTDLTPDCNLLGKAGIVNMKEPILHNQRIGKIIPVSKKVDKGYLMRFFNSNLFSNRMKSTATGSTVRHTSVPTINKTVLALPPLKEQTAIASALSDMDALIAQTEKLIEKKKAIKQGVMQELLFGKRRLVGFAKKEGYKQTEVGLIPEDWEILQSSTICDVRDGTHDSPKYHDKGVPLVTSKNIVNNDLDLTDVSYVSEFDANEINKRSKVDKGDILMSMIGTIGNAVIVKNEPEFCIKNIALFKPKRVSSSFFYQLIISPIYKQYINSKLDGGIQKFISLGVLRSLLIIYPPLPEQEAIANALSDMDTEICVAETKLQKLKLQKQGMMQALLTGKIRLV